MQKLRSPPGGIRHGRTLSSALRQTCVGSSMKPGILVAEMTNSKAWEQFLHVVLCVGRYTSRVYVGCRSDVTYNLKCRTNLSVT